MLKTPAMVQVEANGVGYEMHISLNTYSHIQPLTKGLLFAHLHVREDAHILYGFAEVAEKEIFLQLLSVSGVGAATARMMLSSLKPMEVTRAIIQGNAGLLESIKGIGKKTAERIILELRDKVGKNGVELYNPSLVHNTLEQDALNALIALGIARGAGEQAIRKVFIQDPALTRIEEIIKKALKTL